MNNQINSPQNWKKSLCDYKMTIKDVILNLKQTGLKISLIHNKNKLVGIITDGDIRKGLLKGKNLNDQITDIINRRPIIVSKNLSYSDIVKIINSKKIDHLPHIDKSKNILNLYIRENISNYKKNLCVIMAGGFGERLKPYTNKIPKPLLKIKKKEMLKILLDHILEFNFKNFIITTHYKKDLIKKFIKNNYKFDCQFTEESKPLGTAGALSLIKKPTLDFIVCNCDIVTNIDFDEVLNFHILNNSDATVVLKKIKSKSPYGEVKFSGINITEFYEKRENENFVIAGIYIFSPKVLKILKKNQNIDMITFLKKIQRSKMKVVAFPAHENWTEVGIMKNFKDMN